MPRKAIVTIATRNYAHFAQVLMQACARYHPDADLFVCYADRPPIAWQETTTKTQVLYGDELGIEQWQRFVFQYTPFELSCALKPFVIGKLLERGYEQIIYMDGDMSIYGPLSAAFGALNSDSIVITPHLLKPLPADGKRPDESAFLVSGTYNAGFFAVKQDDNTHEFIKWWQAMCQRNCFVDLAASIFVDQKWLGLVPGMFAGVHVLRNAGYNAGHWSLSQFKVSAIARCEASDSQVAIDGQPLVLFHFSGMTPSSPNDYLTSQTRTSLNCLPALEKIVKRYHQDLAAAGAATCVAWGCEFDKLSDGTAIHPSWREAIRQQHKGFLAVKNPFDVVAHPDLLDKFLSIQPGAYKWRRDWRLKWPKEQGAAGQVRKANKKFKDFFRSLRLLRRSA